MKKVDVCETVVRPDEVFSATSFSFSIDVIYANKSTTHVMRLHVLLVKIDLKSK